MSNQIEEFLIKVELNSDSYITGEFLCNSQDQIHLLNSIYTNGDNIVLPNVTLNMSDIKSVVGLDKSEIKSYLEIIISKNMLNETYKCPRCTDDDRKAIIDNDKTISTGDEYSGIKPIEEGFDSVSEQSSEDSGLKFNGEKDFEPRISDSSEEESSSISEDEDFKEAFKKNLASRNIAVTFKEDIIENKKPTDKGMNKEVITTVSQKDSQRIQNDLKKMNINNITTNNITNNTQNTTTKGWQRPNTNETDNSHKLNRRREGQINPRGGLQDKDLAKKRVFQRTEYSKQTPPKGRIVLGWKQKKYKDGFEILKGISSNFKNSFNTPKKWPDKQDNSWEELRRRK
ncbi:hypothetical protein NGRA_0644 [Nosema granulosis]|uniref:Uncharacterized protein n=1 Tax=Nosema granulosis TaxID=83296 RepID=A0A9P6H357_9MICR|nr:hypothetical protein NGRA_0644 [Nosema granulosis]